MGRVFLAQALDVNGVAVGGLARVSENHAYQGVVQSSPDGAVGAEDVDRAGLSAGVDIECTDVAKANAILDAAPTNTIFFGQEAGTVPSTWQKVTIPGLVLGSMNMNLSKAADGTLSLSGKIRFADGTKDISDVIACLGAQTVPTLTYPARLYRPQSASFNPGVAILPKHLESVALSLSAPIQEDYGDGDIGMTAVDREGFGALQVTLVHKDADVVSGSNRAAELAEAARGVLTVTLAGRGGAANQTLTVNNLLWTSMTPQKGKEHWTFTHVGFAGWRNATGPVLYTLTGANQLFKIV